MRKLVTLAVLTAIAAHAPPSRLLRLPSRLGPSRAIHGIVNGLQLRGGAGAEDEDEDDEEDEGEGEETKTMRIGTDDDEQEGENEDVEALSATGFDPRSTPLAQRVARLTPLIDAALARPRALLAANPLYGLYLQLGSMMLIYKLVGRLDKASFISVSWYHKCQSAGCLHCPV